MNNRVINVIAKEHLLGIISDPTEAKVFMLFYMLNRLGIESVYDEFNAANIHDFIDRLTKV